MPNLEKLSVKLVVEKFEMMKKMKLLSLIAILCFAGFTQVNAQKMGYLNSLELLSLMPESKDADASLKALQDKLSLDGQKKLSAIETKLGSLEARQQSGDITGKELNEAKASLEVDRQALLKFEEDAQKQLLEKRDELYGPIFDKANTAIKDVAKANGYALVFDSSTGVILHGDETGNLLSLVKQKLGI